MTLDEVMTAERTGALNAIRAGRPWGFRLVAEGASPLIITKPNGIRDDNERIPLLALASLELMEKAAAFYVVTMEVWAASYDETMPTRGEPGYRQPRDRDDRQELIVQMGAGRGIEPFGKGYPIERSADGTVTLGEPDLKLKLASPWMHLLDCA